VVARRRRQACMLHKCSRVRGSGRHTQSTYT
jgi:hypothetical protein